MENLANKKLLIISGSKNDISFVQAAREMGIYTICCDGHTDWSRSPAKQAADEGWNIDYSKTEEVARKCLEEGVDGVIAGYSEHRVMAACKIANAIGKPFYATQEQISISRDKKQFKQLCMDSGIPVPRDYCGKLPLTQQQRSSICYPVIVKPADSAGRKGISVCYSEAELDTALENAVRESLNGDIVVEEYVQGTELSAVYTLADGKISLSCLNDKYLAEEGNGTLCGFVISPSRYYEEFMRTVDPGIRTLLKTIGAENGVANFQLIVGANGIRAFEMGYRVNGNDDFKVIRQDNAGLDFVKLLIHHSITGSMGDDLSRDNPCFKKCYCTLVRHLHGGTVGKIDCDKVSEIPEVLDVTLLKQVGSVVVDAGNNLQKAIMVKFCAESREQAAQLVDKIQNNIHFQDQDGKDMLMKPFNPDRLG